MNTDVYFFLKICCDFLRTFLAFYVAFFAYRSRLMCLSVRRVGGRYLDFKPCNEAFYPKYLRSATWVLFSSIQLC